MKEIRHIIQAWHKAVKENKQAALATVVHVEGSSYRRPGARMLITEDGQLTGAISGGCLEGDALRKALWVMNRQAPMLVTYDTMDQDDATLGIGLGCNGIIQVLIEPIDALKENNPVRLLMLAAEKRQHAVLITLFSLEHKKDPQQGTCFIMKEDGSLLHSDDLSIDPVIKQDAVKVLESKTSSFRNYQWEDNSITAFIEYVQPGIALVIIGGGNDVLPLEQMANIIGWQTTIVDGRPAYAKPERFSSGCQVLLSKPEEVLSHINSDEQTAFLLMTHNYNYDYAMLKMLVHTNTGFIGMLGPRKKLERMMTEMNEEGMVLDDQQLDLIHSPVGLDIGAETPEEIALSIIAEIKTFFAGKPAMPLREYTNSIHANMQAAIEEVRVTSKQ